MKKRDEELRKILIKHNYKEIQKEEDENEIKKNNIFKKILFIILRYHLLIIWILLLTIVIIAPLIFLFSSISTYNLLNKNSTNILYSSDNNIKSFTQDFSDDFYHLPYGIPVESGTLKNGYDYTHYSSEIISDFIIHYFYEGHGAIDLGRIYEDKVNGYLPYIINTLNGVIIKIDKRINSNLYEVTQLVNNEYIDFSFSTNNEISDKPYGNSVVVSSYDGRFYTRYSHLSEINQNNYYMFDIERGDIIGKMGNTGNSQGDHLDYEIRYCGDNNSSLYKIWTNCYPVNPLGFYEELNGYTFLGISNTDATNYYAGTNDINNNYISEGEFESNILSEYESFCIFNKYTIENSNVECSEIFPIIYANRNNKIYPNILTYLKESAVNNYLLSEYSNSINNITENKIEEIFNLEGIKNGNLNKTTLISELGNKISFGKYNNINYIYPINNYISNNESDTVQENMFKDVLDSVEYIKTEGVTIEELYMNYFSKYHLGEGKNPFVYNFIDKDSSFLQVKDENNVTVYSYTELGALTIYNIINNN